MIPQQEMPAPILWDWLKLMLVPFVLPVVLIQLTRPGEESSEPAEH